MIKQARGIRRVTKDFSARTRAELSIDEDELLFVLDDHRPGRWLCRRTKRPVNHEQTEGFVPSSCLERAERIYDGWLTRATAASGGHELTLPQHAWVLVYRDSDFDGRAVVGAHGKYGYVHVSYIEQAGERYEYRPLNWEQKEIRMLLLQPSSRTSHRRQGVLQCSMQYAQLATMSSPKYETASYVWGDASHRSCILIDGKVMDVPMSAERVLRSFKAGTVIWIDAVCINQQDVDERGHQVALMADVYTKTTKNYICLHSDDSPGDIEAAVLALYAVWEDARRATHDFDKFTETVVDGESGYDTYADTGLKVDVDFDALVRLFDCAWFSRIWVVQEAALAPSNACGWYHGATGLSFDFLDLVRAARWLDYKRRFLPIDFEREVGIANASTMWMWVDPLSRMHGVRRGPSSDWHSDMLTLLATTRHFKATDARDHIYGVLGLYQKFQGEFEVPELLMPDYTLPLGEVYQRATLSIIKQSQSLECLGFLGPEIDHHDTVASWVVPWGRFLSESPVGDLMNGTFNACGQHRFVRVTGSEDQSGHLPSILTVKGMMVDEVRAVLWTIAPQARPSGWLQRFDAMDEALATHIRSRRERAKTIAMTLTAGIDADQDPADAEELTSGYRALRAFIATHGDFPPQIPYMNDAIREDQIVPVRTLATLGLPTDRPVLFVGPHPHHAPDARPASHYMQAMMNTSSHRSVFITSTGLLGIGPKTMREGDGVALLWACAAPVVLRSLPSAGEYTILGAAYVHGIMMGEAADAHDRAGKLDETFRLV